MEIYRPAQQSVVLTDDCPKELNSAAVGFGITVEKDRLTVRYTGDGRHNNDVGAVQANKPVPRQRLIYYYEVHILDAGKSGKIAIGFAEKQFKLTRQPGWEPGSYGYHGDDGKKFHQSGAGEEYGPKFTTGDVIGAGIHLGKQEMFFTKNGLKLKTAFKNVKGILYPTVGLHSANECVEVNFGAKPFRFDLQRLIAEERAAQAEDINKMEVPASAALQLVCDYLRDSAYANTLAALQSEVAGLQELLHSSSSSSHSLAAGSQSHAAAASTSGTAAAASAAEQNGGQQGSDMAVEGDVTWLALRQQVRLAILSGNMDAAIAAITAACPEVVSGHPDYAHMQYQLYSQKFIELIRQGEVPAALSWAHTALSPLRAVSPALEAHLKDVVALLAYTSPQESPLAGLLSNEQRAEVANAVNAGLLAAAASLPPGSEPPECGLARTLKQILVVHAQLLETAGGQGEPFNLKDMLPP